MKLRFGQANLKQIGRKVIYQSVDQQNDSSDNISVIISNQQQNHSDYCAAIYL